MALRRIGLLPDKALAASARFHAQVLPEVLAAIRSSDHGGDPLTLVFAPADHTHRGWRLAVVQQLAREYAPLRVNALVSDDETAIVAAAAYLERTDGVTGQMLILDGAGAEEVIVSPA